MEEWKISEEHKKLVSSIMTDLWALIKASYEIPDKDKDPDAADHYWSTLAKWGDALAKKYPGNQLVTNLVMAYLETQNNRATGTHGWEVTIITDPNQ
jgi:hypothetical protein